MHVRALSNEKSSVSFAHAQSFSDELITEGRREHFSQRAAHWLKSLELDGLLVQWMFPGQGNGRPSDRQNLPRLMAQLRQVFKASGANLAGILQDTLTPCYTHNI